MELHGISIISLLIILLIAIVLFGAKHLWNLVRDLIIALLEIAKALHPSAQNQKLSKLSEYEDKK